MSRPELKGKIQTVLGPIEPERLGRTLMHEHVLCDIRPPGTRSDNDLGPEITLENVWQINYGHGNKRAEIYDSWAALGARAIVHAGFGGGTVPDYLKAPLAGLRARGVLLVRCSRTGDGPVVRNASIDDDAHGWVVADDQNPPRARLLAALALSRSSDPAAVQAVFLRY